jgi:hypothetical protein
MKPWQTPLNKARTREKKEQGEGDRGDTLSLSQRHKMGHYGGHIESNHGLNLFTQA